MMTKQDALAQIVSLMKEYNIKILDITTQLRLKPISKYDSLAKQFFSYIGGIFILCGLGIYIGQHWGSLNSAARIIVTLGTGLVFFFMAMIAARDARYGKMLTPFFLLAALFEAIGMFVAINELFNGGNSRYVILVIFGTLFIQQIMAFLQIRRAVLLFVSLAFGLGFMAKLLDLVGIDVDYNAAIISFSLLCIAYQLDKTPYSSLTPLWYFIGSLGFLAGTFAIFQHTAIEFFYLGMTALIIYLSTVARSKVLLLNGTVAMIGYIGYFTARHFVHSVGWPIALIAFGLVMLGISAMAVNIGKTMQK